jgi:Fuc2NAc and GlcNAc transferase
VTGGVASLLLVATAFAGAWLGVRLVRGYAGRRLLDLPTARSSHVRPTPRGGGVAIVVLHLATVLGAAAASLVPWTLPVLLAAGLPVALVGFLDDHGEVSPRWRLLAHGAAAAWVVGRLGGLPPLDFGLGPIDLGWLGTGVLLLYLVWFLNLFNFMDGIDGLAASQATFMALAGALLAWQPGSGPETMLPALLLAAATAGFLAWNWPPARIFLGDVGSGYLGFALGGIAVWTVASGRLTAWPWVILGGAFLADATVTLAVRARAGAGLTVPHRTHAYQRLSRYWGGHRPVTLAYLVVNLAWLAPWAWIATHWPARGAAVTVVALAPLFLVAARLGAGRPDELVPPAA